MAKKSEPSLFIKKKIVTVNGEKESQKSKNILIDSEGLGPFGDHNLLSNSHKTDAISRLNDSIHDPLNTKLGIKDLDKSLQTNTVTAVSPNTH